MNKAVKVLKYIGVFAILAYLITYGLAFTAFEYYEPYSYDEWNYATYRINYVLVMVLFGVAFTVALISFLKIQIVIKDSVYSTIIICCFLQIGILFWVSLLAKEVIWFSDKRGDSVFGFHANVVVIMSYIIMVINVVWMLLALVGLTLKFSAKYSQENERQMVCANWSYMHLPAILVPVISVAISSFYLWGVPSIAVIFLFMVFFGIPASILLGDVVRKWIESRKFFPSACAYAIYGYLVYGVVYRWTKGIADTGLSIKDSDNIFFQSILGLLNVIVAVAAIIKLIMMAVKDKKAH